jgi:hypothetical protein
MFKGSIVGGPRDGEDFCFPETTAHIIDGEGKGFVLTTYCFDLREKVWRIAFTHSIYSTGRRGEVQTEDAVSDDEWKIIEDLANCNPVLQSEVRDFSWWECALCGATTDETIDTRKVKRSNTYPAWGPGPIEHEGNCPWVRAKAVIERKTP